MGDGSRSGPETYDPSVFIAASSTRSGCADTETDEIRQLPGLSTVTDFEWAADGTELYIANGGAIEVYSVATNETRELADSSWGADYLAVSPDGQSIAVQGVRASEAQLIV